MKRRVEPRLPFVGRLGSSDTVVQRLPLNLPDAVISNEFDEMP